CRRRAAGGEARPDRGTPSSWRSHAVRLSRSIEITLIELTDRTDYCSLSVLVSQDPIKRPILIHIQGFPPGRLAGRIEGDLLATRPAACPSRSSHRRLSPSPRS